MSWQAIKSAYSSLQLARDNEGDLGIAWGAFRSCVSECPVPFHLKNLLEQIEEIRNSRSKEDIRILDHGCGGALTLLYLAAKGYTGGFGVDIGGSCERWNPIFADKIGAKEQRFFVYEGGTLPFQDSFFDLIFSQEVLEHVRPSVLAEYYAEENRVMKRDAVALHRVPHRLVPYDSHTRTWLLHYLPRPMWLASLRLLGRDLTTAKEATFLRWPWVHRRCARHHIGPTVDVSMNRFESVTDLRDYEGPKGVRRIAGRSVTMPVLGPLAKTLLSNFIMVDTVSTKQEVAGK
jgi:SAM-dependent methyltransferase